MKSHQILKIKIMDKNHVIDYDGIFITLSIKMTDNEKV